MVPCRNAAILVFLIFISAIVFADVGPSPSFSFSITNAVDFPQYSFYYAGNIWQEQLDPVEESTGVYKLNTHITVYAVPEGEEPSIENAVHSRQVTLSSGHTVFEVMNFDADSGTMSLNIVSNISDTPQGTDFLFFFGLPLLVVALIVLVPIAILVAVVLLVLKRQKDGAKKNK